MNLGRPLDAFARWALGPMGLVPRDAMWVLAIAGVIGPAWLFPSEPLAILWLLLWLALFIACWLRSLVRVAVVRRYRQPLVLLQVDDRFRRTTRAVFAVATLIVITRLPLLLSIWVSRPWLDPFAHHVWAEIPASAPLPDGPGVAGRSTHPARPRRRRRRQLRVLRHRRRCLRAHGRRTAPAGPVVGVESAVGRVQVVNSPGSVRRLR
jgi:hypothetical protein